jgi:hypothetical protein
VTPSRQKPLVPGKKRNRTSNSRWTGKDDGLRRLAGKEPLWRISQILERSELSVRWKAKQEEISLSWRSRDRTAVSEPKTKVL